MDHSEPALALVDDLGSTGASDTTVPYMGDVSRPLADCLRPRTLGQAVGQEHLLADEAPIGRMVERRHLVSMILWGPPGCGKTTIARMVADAADLVFAPLSATFSGVADLRTLFRDAEQRRARGEGILLFVDEIHRFNRAQQDSFLPYVEDGTVVVYLATAPKPIAVYRAFGAAWNCSRRTGSLMPPHILSALT